MEPEHTPHEQPVSTFGYLHRVTPLCKYLAIALFITLPFLGAWIGYQVGTSDTERNPNPTSVVRTVQNSVSTSSSVSQDMIPDPSAVPRTRLDQAQAGTTDEPAAATEVQRFAIPEVNGLSNTCTAYTDGCNTCGLDFYDSEFSFSCTELACPNQDKELECLAFAEEPYLEIPSVPFTDGSVRMENCGLATNGLEVYGLERTDTEFRWLSAAENPDSEMNRFALGYKWEEPVCLLDINGDEIRSPKTAAYAAATPARATNTNPPSSNVERQLTNQQVCLTEATKVRGGDWQHCNRQLGLFTSVSPETVSGQVEAIPYDDNCPVVRWNPPVDTSPQCASKVSLYDIYTAQTEPNLTELNEPDDILSDVYTDYVLFKDAPADIAEPQCTAYESACDRCELELRQARTGLAWTWECDQKPNACSGEQLTERSDVRNYFNRTYANKPTVTLAMIEEHTVQCVEYR